MIARGNSAALKGEVSEKVSIVRFGRTSWRGLDFSSGQGPQAEQAGPSRFRHADDRILRWTRLRPVRSAAALTITEGSAAESMVCGGDDFSASNSRNP